MDSSTATGRRSRRKGSRGELELARVFADHGFAARRTPNSGGLHVKDDLTGPGGAPVLPNYLVECKRCERVNVPGWLRKAYAVAGVRQPLLFFRIDDKRQHDPLAYWHVVTAADDYLALHAELRELRRDAAA